MNVNRLVIRYMAAGHVYSDPGWLRGERLYNKLAVTRARGARFSSVRFVTGKLDPLAGRVEFLDLARQAHVPMLMIYGAQTPSRSRAEMEALTVVQSIQSVCLPQGKLSVHEDFTTQLLMLSRPSSPTRINPGSITAPRQVKPGDEGDRVDCLLSMGPPNNRCIASDARTARSASSPAPPGSRPSWRLCRPFPQRLPRRYRDKRQQDRAIPHHPAQRQYPLIPPDRRTSP